MVHLYALYGNHPWGWTMAPDTEQPSAGTAPSSQTQPDRAEAHEPETDIGRRMAEALRRAEEAERSGGGEHPPGWLDLPPLREEPGEGEEPPGPTSPPGWLDLPPLRKKPDEGEEPTGPTIPRRRVRPQDPREFDPDEHPFPHEHGLNPDLEYKLDVLIAQQHRMVQQGQLVNQAMGCLVGLLLGLLLLLANIAQALNALQALLGWIAGMLAFLTVQWMRFLRAWQGPPPRWWPRLQYAWWRARWADYWRPWAWISTVWFLVGIGGMAFALGLVGGQEAPPPATPTPTAPAMALPATEAAVVVEPSPTATPKPALPPTEAQPPTATPSPSPTPTPTITPTPVDITASLSYAHTQPGVYSQVFLTITGPPQTPFQFTLSGPGVTGQRTFSGVLDETGEATLVWRIVAYGRYTAQGFIGEESITRTVQVRP